MSLLCVPVMAPQPAPPRLHLNGLVKDERTISYRTQWNQVMYRTTHSSYGVDMRLRNPARETKLRPAVADGNPMDAERNITDQTFVL